MTDITSRLADLSPEKRRLLALKLKQKAAAAEAAEAAAGGGERPSEFPASFAQRRMWLLDRLEPGSTAYSLPRTWRIPGPLDTAALERALDELVRRHETLRTHLEERAGELVQVVAPPAPFRLEVTDLSALPPDEAWAELGRLAHADASAPFRLEEGPLFRASLVRLAEDDHALLWNLHHAVTDGWSSGILSSELTTLYAAFSRGQPSPLAPLPLQYGDHAVRERERLSGDALARLVGFWRDTLEGAPTRLEIAPDRPRPPARTHHGASVEVFLGAGLPARVDALARAHDATPFMVYLAAFQLLLGRYARQDDVLVGTAVANRASPEVEGIVGFFVNTLVLRGDLSGDPTFRELLGRVREATLGAFDHQALPFEKLVEELNPERSLSHAPLVQAVIVLHNQHGVTGGPAAAADAAAPALRLEAMGGQEEAARFDLSLDLAQSPDGLYARCSYAADFLEESTVRRMLGHLATLLESAVRAPDAPLSALSMLDAAERAALVAAGSATASYQVAYALPAMFAEQAARTPNAPALTFGGESVTYAELDARANRLAHHLAKRGAARDSLVGLLVERSIETIVGILGILKSGAGYLPLDPAYPDDRLAYMLEDSGAPIVVTSSHLADRLSSEGMTIIRVDSDADAIAVGSFNAPSIDISPDSLAYVIYTSGSTGKPKGVQVTHANVVRLFAATDHWFGFGAEDVWTLFHSYAFDFSVWEIWGALLYGGRLVIVPFEVSRSPEEFYALLETEGVTVLNQTPSAFRQLMRADEEAAGRGEMRDLALRHVVFGGEALDPATLRGWVDRRGDDRPHLVNMYGITETTVHVTYRVIREADVRGGSSSPIGIPIPDLSVHLLDRNGQIVPTGVVGEMYVGGGGVARGYLNRPELTEQRFVRDPFSGDADARLYRSGDLARRMADGSLEFQGRADDQVKVRGFRIELGEIESVLLDHPRVREAVVLTRGEAEATRLVAWIVAAGEVSAAELRAHLLEHLPEYMVPSAFVMLDSLPLTRNGKVDRRALPDPDAAALAGAEYVAPRTPTEEALATIWAELLGAERVGATDGFFALGGHSLLATRLASRLRAELEIELPVRAVFEHSTMGALAAEVDRLRGGAREQGAPLAADPRETDLPLSFAQERLWFIDRLDPGSAVYNMTFPMRMRGPLDAAALERALDEVARRHAVLRTRFALVGGAPVQRIAPAGGLRLPVDDLSALDEAEREEELVRRVGEAAGTPFDLEAGPLFRPRLFRMAPEDHALLVQMHHAVSDGWSMGIFWSELFTLYDAFRQGRPSPLAELPLRYADFAAWQREWLRGERLDAQVAWWRDHLAGAPAVLELPADRPRPPARSQRGAGFPFALPAELAEAVRALAAREGATPFMVLMAAWSLFLARCSGQDDVVVGTPVAGRTRAETEAMIGLFVNTLAVRTDLSGDPTFAALLARVREATLGAYAHQDLPFERLVEELRPERSLSHTPVFQVMLTFQNTPEGEAAGGPSGLELGGVRREGVVSRVDLTLILGDLPDGRMAGLLEYATDLFEEATAGRLVSHFATLLDAAARAPETPVSLIPLMGDAERDALVAAGSAPATHEAARALPALFAEQAARTPHAPALTSGGESITYAELDARANRLAHHLRKRGARPDSLVGLLVERSIETVVGILGILKSGAGYLPLDPEYPEDRLAYMLEDSGASIVVASSHLADRLSGDATTIIRVDSDAGEIAAESPDAPAIDVSPESLAYVIYTSGSTGTPKGVGVPHRAVARLVRGTDFAELGPEQVFLQLAPVTFDASTLEIWGPLLNGGRLVMAPAEPPSLRGIAELVRGQGVTTLWLTAGLFHRMVDEELDALGSLRQLLAGGDVLSAPHVRKVLEAHPRLRLINGYGPTENTTFTCCHTVRPEDAERASIPIGRPIAGTSAWVLDGAMRPCPVGVPGELYAGGHGLARGYLGRAGQTAASFVPDPFSIQPGARLYRTGDRVRRLEDGTLEFLGRIDQQVKVRGYRIEPGEVEAALKAHPAVGDAVVVARAEDGGDRRLVAYVVARGGSTPSAAELREALASRLPGHMVPSAFVALDAIPLTANGKVDRRALPAPDSVVGEEAYVAPRTPTEALLADVWATLLGAARVGVNDSFFALGGHSLLATRLVSRVRSDLGLELPVRAVFEHATLAALAAEVDRLRAAAGGVEAPPIVPVPREGDLPLSFAQERLWFVDRMEAGSATYHMPRFVRLEGELDEEALRRALDELVRRHESLRTRFPLVDGLPMQRVAPPGPADLIVHDFSALRDDEKEDEGSRLVREHAQIPFWLETGPLYRVDLARLGERDHLLLLTVHHIIADGWSLDLLWRELGQLYGAFSRGEPSPLPEPRVQYGDFAAWQRAWLTGAVLERQLAYWRRALEGAPALLELPTDRPRPAVQTHRGATEMAFLPRDAADAVLALARREGSTLFMVLLAALDLVFARQSGQEDVVVGTPIAGRTRAETEGVAGLFLNSLALRVRLAGDPTFRELLRRVRETTLDAYAHQDVPFEAVLEEIHPERVLDRTPVFQVMLNLTNFGDETAEGDGGFPGLVEHGVGRLAELASKFDLTIYAGENPGGISLQAVYNPDLFDAARIRALLDQAVSVLAQATAEPERRFDRFTLGEGVEPAEAARAVRTATGLPAGVGEPGIVWEMRGGEWTKTAGRGRYRPDGTIDPAACPAVSPAAAVPAAAAPVAAPASPADAGESGTLAEMLAIWRELLDPSVGPDDDFFDVGGHSLLGVKLLAQVKKRLGVTLPLQALFASPTPVLLAAQVESHGSETTFDHLVPLSPEGTAGGPPLFCMHAAGGTVFRYRGLAERLAPEWPVIAVQAKGVTDGGGPLRSVDAMAERYVEEVRRAQPRGPYYLAGWSSGGVVALEVAHRLRAGGEEVAMVALFDSSPPDAEAAIPDPVALYLLFAAGFSAKEEVAMKALEDELRELPVDQRLGRLAAWLAVHSGEERVHELESLRSIVEVFRANIGASRRHPLAPYPGRVALFCAEWGHGLGWEEAALPELWRPHVTGELEVHVVPGAHHSMLSEPYIRGLEMVLRETLASVREEAGAGAG